jgi:hypothetical protein
MKNSVRTEISLSFALLGALLALVIIQALESRSFLVGIGIGALTGIVGVVVGVLWSTVLNYKQEREEKLFEIKKLINSHTVQGLRRHQGRASEDPRSPAQEQEAKAPEKVAQRSIELSGSGVGREFGAMTKVVEQLERAHEVCVYGLTETDLAALSENLKKAGFDVSYDFEGLETKLIVKEKL